MLGVAEVVGELVVDEGRARLGSLGVLAIGEYVEAGKFELGEQLERPPLVEIQGGPGIRSEVLANLVRAGAPGTVGCRTRSILGRVSRRGRAEPLEVWENKSYFT